MRMLRKTVFFGSCVFALSNIVVYHMSCTYADVCGFVFGELIHKPLPLVSSLLDVSWWPICFCIAYTIVAIATLTFSKTIMCLISLLLLVFVEFIVLVLCWSAVCQPLLYLLPINCF